MQPHTTEQNRARRWKSFAVAGSILITATSATSAYAQLTPAPAAAAEEEPITMLEFFVSGKGESRATNAIAPADLELSIPGVQAEKLLDRMPGINVVSTDPFGFYEFGNDIRVRAFNLSKLAVTLDGVPMGNNDPRYGTPIGRMIDTENLTTIKVSQGAGDVTTPAYEALGGSLQYFTQDPSKEMGAMVRATYGDFAQKRLFAKFETGELVPGLTAYVSASHFEFEPRGLENLAKGMSRRMEAKARYDTEKATFRFVFTYNDRDDFDTNDIGWSDYQDLLVDNYRGTGNGFTEYTPWDYPASVYEDMDGFSYGILTDQGRRFGPPAYIDPNVGPGEGVNAQYYNLWKNGRMDYFSRMIADIDLTPDMKLKITPYYQDKRNYGTFGVPKSVAESEIRAAYAAAPDRDDIWAKMYYDAAGNPIDAEGNIVTEYSSAHAVAAPTATPDNYIAGVPGRTGRDEDFGGHRYGVSGNLEWKTEKHTLLVGGWYEYDHHAAVRPTYNLEGGSITGGFEYDQPLFLNYSRYFDTNVYQGWVQDTYKMFDDKLSLIGGIKALKLERNVKGFLDIPTWRSNSPVYREVAYDDYFLPQLGVLYKLTNDLELFFNYSENMATPTSATLASPSGFEPSLLSPEYSDNFDIGVRGEWNKVSYTVQAYYIQYVDRILSVPIPLSAGIGRAGQNAFQNVGGVDSLGAEASAEWKTPIKGLDFTGSIALQKTTFQEDLPSGVNELTGELVYLPIQDNDLGNTPFLTANFDVRYRFKDFRFTFGGKYFDSVYINSLNTQELSSYTVFDASATYFGRKGTALEGFEASINVYNAFDEYFWTATSYNGTSGRIQADQGRQISFTVTARF